MKLRYIEEPSLQFGRDQHICPKQGIYSFSPFDIDNVRPEKITIGIIGKPESINLIVEWLESCKTHIDGKETKTPRTNLFLNFCGFNKKIGFKSEIAYDQTYLRQINNSDFNDIIDNCKDLEERIESVAGLYLAEIKFLSKNKNPDVILCVLNDKFLTSIKEADTINSTDDQSDDLPIEIEEIDYKEQNFRRYLKAKAMQYHVPIQLVRDSIAKPSGGMQDASTIAWNFFTALYYKASGTPWALVRKDFSETTCYAGISFYQSRDRKTIQTSLAQIFNESGNGVILRGEEVQTSKNDRTPHLSEEQAFQLLYTSLKEYYEAVKVFPKRIVLHKTSNFSPDEIYGFKQAAKQSNIFQIDLVTIMNTDFRLYRAGQYPPLRGTHLALSEKEHILYTRGSVPFFETYPGMYIPSPIKVRLFEYDESPNLICEEILGLTKMNWNNSQFDRRFPITLECARNVGEILKYLDKTDVMELKYCYYM